MRGQWFIDGTWLPLEEEESDLIEHEHLNHFRGQQMQDSFETDLVVRTVDSKDGERTGRERVEEEVCMIFLRNVWQKPLNLERSFRQHSKEASILVMKV